MEGGGVPRAREGSVGQSTPLLHSLHTSHLGTWLPKFCSLGVSPPSPASASVSPLETADVIIKEREAMINHLSLELQGRFQSDRHKGTQVAFPVPCCPCYHAIFQAEFSLAAAWGKVGTCSVSYECHLSCPWLSALLGCNVRHPLICDWCCPILTLLLPLLFLAFLDFPLMSNLGLCSGSLSYLSPFLAAVFLISIFLLPFLLFTFFISYLSHHCSSPAVRAAAPAILPRTMGFPVPSSLAGRHSKNGSSCSSGWCLQMKPPRTSQLRDVFRVPMMVLVPYSLGTSRHQATPNRRWRGWQSTVGQAFDRSWFYTGKNQKVQRAPDLAPDFQVEAEEDIKSETSGILQDLLLALAKGGRESYSGIIDYNLAEQDVQDGHSGSRL
ncbi:annexin A9 isoform X2 [Lemur catta]|uniref:annexin A9 isoform X2 n=1 Tax=Lemur catta TaxID=9447 RepID=UPI001E26CF0B|nr:annexin A9 isoform X2 [Lemur catta]